MLMPIGRRQLLGALTGAATVVAIRGGNRLRAEGERFLRIGTGPTGGSYFPIGGLIANVISNPPGSVGCNAGGSCGVPGVIAAAVASQGSVANMADLADRRIDLAISQADVARDAFTAAGAFAGKPPLAALRAIASLYGEAVHVVVRTQDEIATVAQLRHKRVALGERDSGTLATARLVLRAYRLDDKDLTASYDPLARATAALAQNKIDALFMVGGYPIEAIARLAETVPIALLPITGDAAASVTRTDASLRPVEIPGGTYTGVGPTQTIGPRAQLLTMLTLDADLVYAITAALWNPRNRRILDSGHPLARGIRLADALDGLTVPLHPGALRYYKETVMKPAEER